MRHRIVWIAIILAGTLVAGRPLEAQSPAGNVEQFDIAPQSLESALLEFSEQAELQLVVDGNLLKGKDSTGFTGKQTAEQVLVALLDDTNLTFTTVGATVTITREGARKRAESTDAETAQENVGNTLERQRTETGEDEGESEQEEDELAGPLELRTQIVTGSRLQTVPAASPVYVLSRDEIDRRGLKNMEDIVRYLPQNFPTILSGGSFDARSPRFSQGTVTINLRGLGEGSTLVLVNGKRIAASPAERGTFTDVSTIPFSAIDRVEMITDGASAIYGSDAVGGVVNFILKQNYRGAESSLRYENSSSGGDLRVFEQTLGFSWETGNLTASFNSSEEDPVFAGDAKLDIDWDYREQGGRFFPATRGQPGIITRFGQFPPGAPPNSRYAILPTGDGTNIDSSRIVYVSHEEWLTRTGNFNLFPANASSRATAEATPTTEHLAGYLSVSQELGERLTLDFRGTFSEQEVVGRAYGNGFRATVPTSNYYNTLGAAVNIDYTFEREIADGLLEPFTRTTDSKRLSLSSRLTWDLPVRNWQAILSLGYGESEFYNGYPGSFNTRSDAFREALASPDPAIAINPFGDGSVQRADLRDFQEYATRGSRIGEQKTAGLTFSGSIYELAGGSIELALGAEARTDTLDFEDFLLNPFTFRLPDPPDVVPESDNSAWFAELSVPLVGDNNARPGIHRLSLYAAGRYDDYRIMGPFEGPSEPDSRREFDDFVAKLGIAWYPVENLKLRTTWSEAFQAPTLPELFVPPFFWNPPYTPPFFSVFDPFNPAENGGAFTPVYPVLATNGNPDLRPQTSDTITFGFEFRPSQWPGAYLSATWNKTEFEGLIGSLDSALGRPPLFALEHPELFRGLVERDANGVLTFLSYQSANLAHRVSEAVDIEVRYRTDTALGEFVAGAFATRTLALDTTPVVGVDPVEQEGTDAGPVRLKGNAYLDYSFGNWTANLTVNYESGYRNTDPDAVATSVDSYTTVDVQGTYVLPASGWRLTLGAQNVFDADFPFYDSYYGVDSAHVDFRRRIVFVDIVKEFTW